MRTLVERRSRLAILLAVIASVLTFGIVQSGVAQATTFGFVNPFYSRSWCLNAEGILNGSQVNTVQCNSANDSQWAAIQVGSNLYEIQDIQGKCLEDHNDGGSGTILNTWNCLNNSTQQWFVNTFQGGQPIIWENWASGLCLNMTANHGAQVWVCNGTNSQYEFGPPPFT